MRTLRQDSAAALPLRHLPESSWLLFARDGPAPAPPEAAASAAQPAAGASAPGLAERLPEAGAELGAEVGAEAGAEAGAEGRAVCCDLSLDPPCKGMAGWHGE